MSIAAGEGAVQLPPWLKPERFEDPTFNPEAVVADLRRHVPLNIAKGELQTYLVRLKEQLIEVINQDFGDYVGLASRLNSVDGSVVRMKQPLLDIRAKLDAVQDALKSELLALQQGLERRQDIATARGTLELMQEVAHVASKVEKLLAEVQAASAAASATDGGGEGDGSKGGGDAPVAHSAAWAGAQASSSVDAAVADAAPGDADAHARLLERVAAEVSRLSFLANKGKDLAFVASVERRIQLARLQLSSHLSGALAAALQQRAWQAAAHCLHAYVELGDAPAGEATLRAALAAPLAAEAVKEARQRAAADAGAKGQELAIASQAFLSGLEQRAGPLLRAALAPASGLGAFDVLGAVLLQELSQAAADGLPGAFSPGNPASFHSNYLAGQALVASLEALARTRAAVERVRSGDAYAAFQKRWNLPVYFSLQYQETAGALEDAARAPRLEPAPAAAGGEGAGDAGLQLAATAALWGCLRRCVSPRVFLAPLADKFLRLACQLAARYASWARAAAAARGDAAAGAGAAAPPAAPAAAAPGSPPAGGAAAAAAPPPARHGPEAWAGQVAAEDLLAICCDAAAAAELLTGRLRGDLLALLPGIDDAAAARVGAALEAAAAGVSEASDQVLAVVADEVAERCVAVVRQLKGITATYRMTSKGPPTRHSHYVSGALAPLRQALDAHGAPSRLPPALSRRLAAAVFDRVNARYQQLAEELLSSVRKTESSLKRLKKGRGPDGGGGGGDVASEMSDSEKICLQLYLDVQEHGRQAAKFSVNASVAASFAALLAAVTPAAAPAASGGGGPSSTGGGDGLSPQHPARLPDGAGPGALPQGAPFVPPGAGAPPYSQPYQQQPQPFAQQQPFTPQQAQPPPGAPPGY